MNITRHFKPVVTVLGIALLAASCTYTHNAATLTVVDGDEYWGDEPFVSILDYSVTPGTAGSATVTWSGGTGEIASGVYDGIVLAIPAAIGGSSFGIDYSECERVSNGLLPTIFGQVVVAFEDDDSSQQASFMGDAATQLDTALATFESMTFADLNDCSGVVTTIAGGLSAVTGMENWVATEWDDYDEGYFTDDDDLVGTGVTAYALASSHLGGLDSLIETAFGAALGGPNQAGGEANNVSTTDGRSDTLTISGAGSTYDIAIVLDNSGAP